MYSDFHFQQIEFGYGFRGFRLLGSAFAKMVWISIFIHVNFIHLLDFLNFDFYADTILLHAGHYEPCMHYQHLHLYTFTDTEAARQITVALYLTIYHITVGLLND